MATLQHMKKHPMAVLFLALVACNPTQPSITAPVISSLLASPSSINAGNSSTLSWVVDGTSPTLSLDQGIGTVPGTSRSVSPNSSTTYTLTASNSAGSVSRAVTVTVPPVGTNTSPCNHFLAVTANAVNKSKGYPDPVLLATCTDSSFTVQSNGIPNFEFVISNPNQLKAQNYNFSLPRNPSFAASTTAVPLGGSIGITINGLPIFGPTEAPNDGYKDPYLNGILDYCNGHPAQRGDYHLHARPNTTACIADISVVGQVLGYAFDGFPIVGPYSCTDASCTSKKKLLSSWRVKTGVNAQTSPAWDAHEYVAGLGDLDKCNGYTRSDGSYAYVATDSFPYFVGCYKGTPTLSIPPQ
jgi:hypothetical protein